jgi:hypothetical protein
MKASDTWWKFLWWSAIAGFIGVDGLVGIVGKKPSDRFSQGLAIVLVTTSIVLALIGLAVGLIRFIKWAWKD